MNGKNASFFSPPELYDAIVDLDIPRSFDTLRAMVASGDVRLIKLRSEHQPGNSPLPIEQVNGIGDFVARLADEILDALIEGLIERHISLAEFDRCYERARGYAKEQCFAWWTLFLENLVVTNELGQEFSNFEALGFSSEGADDSFLHRPVDTCGSGEDRRTRYRTCVAMAYKEFISETTDFCADFVGHVESKALAPSGELPSDPTHSVNETFPGRASWLKERLRERSWSEHDLARHRGPDRKTTQKVLAGRSVRDDVLEKLATALSEKFAKVTVLDIPGD